METCHDTRQYEDYPRRGSAMIVARWEGGVRIELDETEAVDLADFLHQFYEPTESTPDRLCARLDDALSIERG